MLELGALDAHIDGLSPGGLEQRLRLEHVRPGGDAGVVLVLRELDRSLESGDGRVEQLLLHILGA